jgi:hypothetical protein
MQDRELRPEEIMAATHLVKKGWRQRRAIRKARKALRKGQSKRNDWDEAVERFTPKD